MTKPPIRKVAVPARKKPTSTIPQRTPLSGRPNQAHADTYTKVGADLKAMRLEIGWSAVQVATMVKRSEGWIRKIERGAIPCPGKLLNWLTDTRNALRQVRPPSLD